MQASTFTLHMALDYIQFLETALMSPDNPGALDGVRLHRDAILEELERDEVRDRIDAIWDLGAVDPEWLAAIYEALSAVEGEAEPLAPEAFFAHEGEDRDIGRAVGEVLLPGLPPPLRRPERWLELAPSLEAGHVRALAARPDVQAAPRFPEGFLHKGVTPVTIFQSFEAISTLVDRARHLGHVSREIPLFLDCTERYLQAGPDPLRAEVVIGEIRAMTGCGPDVARGLCHWLIPVSWCLPTAFERVGVLKTAYGVELRPAQRTVENLFERWRTAGRPALDGLDRIEAACSHDRSRVGMPQLVPV